MHPTIMCSHLLPDSICILSLQIAICTATDTAVVWDTKANKSVATLSQSSLKGAEIVSAAWVRHEDGKWGIITLINSGSRRSLCGYLVLWYD
jgi:hypothetical protein